MKSLKFNHIEADNIKNGIQTATLRIDDDKSITVDDKIVVIDKVREDQPETWTDIGVASVNKVSIQRIGDLDLEQGNFEKFGSTSELYEQMALFYGDIVNENTHVKVIEFDFTPRIMRINAKSNDDNATTKHVEIQLFGDGGSRGNPGPSASGYVIIDMNNHVIETNGEFLNITTNNQAEYHSLRLGLERAHQLGAEIVHVYMDSMLVINQMKGIFKVKNKDLLGVYRAVKELTYKFRSVDFTHVPREYNKLADAEVNRILDANQNLV